MFMDLLSESCEEGGEFLYWVTKMSQYFEDTFFQISLKFLVIFYKLLQLRQTHWIRNASFLLAIFVSQESIVMIIKHHTYTHCTFRLYI